MTNVKSITNLKLPSSAESILDQTLRDAFPEIDPGVKPFGSLVLVQIKSAARRTKAGLILNDSDVETEHDNTQTAKVLALGPGAFRNRDTLAPWPEGDWVKPGMFVRVPKYGGDRWRRPSENGSVVFSLYEDLHIKGEITIDPLSMRAFL